MTFHVGAGSRLGRAAEAVLAAAAAEALEASRPDSTLHLLSSTASSPRWCVKSTTDVSAMHDCPS